MFEYYRTITIDHTKVSGDLVNFPILVNGTIPSLKTVANGGKVHNANGYDIGFYSDIGLTVKLSWETERYIATTGEVLYWVRIPALSSSVNTVIYLAYADTTITTDQSVPSTVWDGSFKGVWHLPDGTTLTANDSTSNALNGTLAGTPNPSAVTGRVGGGASFNSANRIFAGDSGGADITGPITLECWAFPTSDGDYRTLLSKAKGNAGDIREYAYFLNIAGTGFLYVSMGNSNLGDVAISTPWALNAWNYIVLTADGSNVKAYVNGVLANTTASALVAVTNTSKGPVRFGANYSDEQFPFVGTLDEIRISTTARSASWIGTVYATINDAAFFTLGSETANGTPLTVSVSDQLVLIDSLLLFGTGRLGLSDQIVLNDTISTSLDLSTQAIRLQYLRRYLNDVKSN